MYNTLKPVARKENMEHGIRTNISCRNQQIKDRPRMQKILIEGNNDILYYNINKQVWSENNLKKWTNNPKTWIINFRSGGYLIILSVIGISYLFRHCTTVLLIDHWSRRHS